MTWRVWLIFTKDGIDRMLKREPTEALGRGEKVAAVDVTVDPAIFQPPPKLSASISLEGPHITEGSVVLDPHAPATAYRGDFAQATLNTMAARLFEKVLNKGDDELQAMAIDALATCKQAGVIVKVNIPEPPETDAEPE